MDDFVEAFELKARGSEVPTEGRRRTACGYPGELCEFGELFPARSRMVSQKLRGHARLPAASTWRSPSPILGKQ